MPLQRQAERSPRGLGEVVLIVITPPVHGDLRRLDTASRGNA